MKQMLTYKFIAAFIAVVTVMLASGCASSDPNRESEMPWSTPQTWEGAPSIPGMGGDR